MVNTIDETGNENEDENEDENGHEAPDKDEIEQEDLEEASMNNNNETDPDTMSDTMDKHCGARTRTNMRSRKRKSDFPSKLRIHLKINCKRSKVLHANAMVQTMGKTHLDLRDYVRIHVTIHCGPRQYDNVMRNPLITTILTQYDLSKGLKVFGDPGVAAFLKELKQLHDRMVMDPKNANEMTMSKRRQRSNI